MLTEFDNIIARLKQGRLWDFPGGVFPPERKLPASAQNIKRVPLANRFYVPVKQHIGTEGSLLVKAGDQVLKGQALSRSTNPFSVPVHAPTSGTIAAIGPHVSAHPSALAETTIEIHADGKDEWAECKSLSNYQQLPKMALLEAICQAGISGMGGAGFPTHIKVAPKKDVEFLIINGIECEPYISSDDRLMQEHAWQIRQGIDVLQHLLSPKQVIIAVEDNKPAALDAMQVACQDNPAYLVLSIPTKYPAGGEKQLIQVLTGREVPQHGLPIDVGIIMQNVGTCYAVADAIFAGKPLLERVITLTGNALERPANMWVRIGTPISHLLTQAGYKPKKQAQAQVIMGGPMMGFTVASKQVPVIKTTNCLLVPAEGEISASDNEKPCIRCSACADACPAQLLPQQLYWHTKGNELDKAQDYNLFDCIECGACAYVCPSEIPLVHYYRVAKAEIRQQEEEAQKADKARNRFEARKARLEQEKLEREEKHRRAAEARKQAMQKDGGAQDKIAAALARAKAKKAQQQPASPSVPETAERQDVAATDSNKARVAAAIARAKAKRETNQNTEQAAVAESADTQLKADTDNNKPKVAEAIARAKAKREARQETDQADVADLTEQHEKREKVAAAVARAKAKRAQKHQNMPENDSAGNNVQEDSSQDQRKQKIAAAVARAKAKKLAEEKLKNSSDQDESQ